MVRKESPTRPEPRLDPDPDLDLDLDPDLDQAPDEAEYASRPGWGRRLFWLLAGMFVTLVLVLGLGLVGGLPSWLPGFTNPFQEETTDRSQPVLLESIQDLSRFTAASGNFEVIIDREVNRRFIPDWIVGERILFVAAGSVDTYVEFGGLAGDALVVNETTDTVEVTLPAPELAPVAIDHERSYVYAEQRGAANRIRDIFADDPNELQEILLVAEDRIAEAAEASGLRERAEENTRAMLVGMFGSLGFDVVSVDFVAP